MRNHIVTILIFLNLFAFAQTGPINQTDANNQKQGYWILYFGNTQKKLEEGTYTNSKREGVWIQYLENGTLSSEITYKNDEPNGLAKIYYPSGQISEEGNWVKDKWVGEYKAYHENGKLIYKWQFNPSGQRTGKQEYFHENGVPMIVGTWANGTESGVVKSYNQKGELILEQTFDKGQVKPELTVEFQPNKSEVAVNKEESSNQTMRRDTLKVEAKDLELFNATGERKIYDTNKRLKEEGYFEKGVLINGKKYIYEGDKLVSILIIKNGRQVEKLKPTAK